MSLPTCPKCGCQLEVKLIFASGPKSKRLPAVEDIGPLLEEAEAKANLTPFEQDFLISLRDRYDKYGAATTLSDKQREILERIANG